MHVDRLMIQDGTCLTDVFAATALSPLQPSDSQSPSLTRKPSENQRQNLRSGLLLLAVRCVNLSEDEDPY